MGFRLLSYSLTSSLLSGYDTLGSQAYGKGEYEMCGVYMYRAWLIINIFAIPTYFAVFLSEYVLILFGTTPEAASMAAAMSKRLILSYWLQLMYDTFNRFLIIQRITKPQLYISGITSILHPIWVYLFIVTFHGGYLAVAWALALTNFTRALFVILYAFKSGECERTLRPITNSAFIGWTDFLKIGIPSGMMYAFESISYLIVGIFSGSFDHASLAVHQIYSNLLSLCFTIPVAIGIAACALVGNSLGANKVRLAKLYAKYVVIGNQIIVTSFIILVGIFCHQIARLYSNDPSVEKVFVSSLFIVFLEFLTDSLQGILCRIIVAMARQRFAAAVNLFAYFAYLVPIAYILVFWLNWGLFAIWFSYFTSYLWSDIAFAYKILSENWELVAIEARERIEYDRKQIAEAKMENEKNSKNIPLTEI